RAGHGGVAGEAVHHAAAIDARRFAVLAAERERVEAEPAARREAAAQAVAHALRIHLGPPVGAHVDRPVDVVGAGADAVARILVHHLVEAGLHHLEPAERALV